MEKWALGQLPPSHIIWPVTEVVNVVTASFRDLTVKCVVIEKGESEANGIRLQSMPWLFRLLFAVISDLDLNDGMKGHEIGRLV